MVSFMNYCRLIVCLLLLPLKISAAIIPTIFGNVDERNPVILELIASNTMQRLKHIDQSGPEPYFGASVPYFNRYDHSIGVYALLKRYHVSQQEQIAGLLHDASHTVFSHLADFVFQNGAQRTESYQDDMHGWYLQRSDAAQIMQRHNLTAADISPKNPQFTALEQSFPDMNADRIEYNLHTALILQDLNPAEVQQILAALHYANKKWYFTDIIQAKRLAKLSTYYNKAFWGATHNLAFVTVATAAIKLALERDIISKQEMHFGVDKQIVDRLKQSTDPQLQKLITLLHDIDQYCTAADASDYDLHIPIKMRGIDPLVLQDGKLQRLSNLCFDIKNELALTKEYTQRGAYIKFINIDDHDTVKLIIHANK